MYLQFPIQISCPYMPPIIYLKEYRSIRIQVELHSAVSIANSINAPYAKDIVDDFAAKTNTQIMEYIPRSVTVTQSELQGKTTIENAPNSEQAKIYTRLAMKIVAHTESKTPSPLGVHELRDWAKNWSDILLEQEQEL